MSADRNRTAAASALRLWLAGLTDEYDETVAQVDMRAIAELLELPADASKDPNFCVLCAKNLELTMEQALWEANMGSPRPTTDDRRNVAEHMLSLIEQVLNGAGAPEPQTEPQGNGALHA